MLRVATACVLLLLAACGGAKVRPAAPKGQIITLSDSILRTAGTDTVRFGRMGSGEVAVKTLLLHNVSARPVVILSYSRTCGCTTFEYDPQPIMPGDTTVARLTFDSRGLEGWQFKVLDVEIAGAASALKIYIDAEVE